MRISYNWLSTFIQLPNTLDEICEMLTMSGLEVDHLEKTESIKGGLKGLVVGRVLTTKAHPNADKLQITTVDVGDKDPLTIVCGASNVAPNQHVVVAPVGCTIYPTKGEPFAITEAKIRGEKSSGMICAEDEIGLGENHDGIMVLSSETTVGSLLSEYYEIIEDHILDIAIIPNRGDAISHLGIARELKALTEIRYTMPLVNSFDKRGKRLAIEIVDTEACPRYSAVHISNVKVGDSPDWLKQRLTSIGLKPINNIVDITNFVQHELGQPLHAFDFNQIADQKIVVRWARENETLMTLDGVERKLSQTHLVICDSQKPLALAGILGGIDSGVTDHTVNILIESAYFQPGAIRSSAKSFGLNTESSYRYERGTDPNINVLALKRAIDLVLQIAGGTLQSEITDIYPSPIEPAVVKFSIEKFNSFIGHSLDKETITKILSNLEIEISANNDDNLLLSIPPFRSDVTRPVDVYEEILRVYGFNKIPIPPNVNYIPSVNSNLSPDKIKQKAANYLSAIGFNELLTNSLVPEKWYSKDELQGAINLLNPLSADMSILRLDTLNSILQPIAFNQNRKNMDLKFYEFGKTYCLGEKEHTYIEKNVLTLAISGRVHQEHWTTKSDTVKNHHLQSIVHLLFSKLNLPKKQYNTLYTLENVPESLLKTHGIKFPVISATIDWDKVLGHVTDEVSLREIPKFPVVRRDLALVVDKDVQFVQIEKIAKKLAQPYLQNTLLFDVYEGKPLEKSQKSLGIAFLLYDDKKTMEEEVIDTLLQKLIGAYETELKATIRR